MIPPPLLQATGVIVTAVAVAVSVAVLQCNAAGACISEGTCEAVGVCSYKNTVSILTDGMYVDYKHNMSRFQELTRGVCAPGERVHINSVSGSEECAPWRAYPDALNREIMGSGSSKHRQMCGAWLDAGPLFPASNEYWSFYDSANEARAIRNSESKSFTSARLASTDLGKLYASCQHTMMSGPGASRESSAQGYRFLANQISNVTTRKRALYTTGLLAGHHCDSTAQVGVSLTGSSFTATITRGSAFTSQALSEALMAGKAAPHLIPLAVTANDAINEQSGTAEAASFRDLEHLFEGASTRTDHATVRLSYESTPELNGLLRLVEQGRFHEIHALLHSQAAYCAFAVHSGMTIEDAGAYSNAVEQMHRISNAKPKAEALGRLRRIGDDVMELSVTNTSLQEASTVTFSSIRSSPPAQVDTRRVATPQLDCVEFTQWLFPDRLDAQYFDAIVTPKLYSRLQSITEQLRSSVQFVVVNDPQIAPTMRSPAAVAEEVGRTRVRIAGAPRGTWAGISRGVVDAKLSSRDGPTVGGLKQARALFLDRIDMLFGDFGTSACNGPAIFSSLETNAFIWPGGRCAFVLLGVLRKPWADERYFGESLSTRIGYVIAHELAHNTLVTAWTPSMSSLLSRYSSNLHAEAVADVIAAVAIIHSGLAAAEEVCRHISQLWCARTVFGYTPSSSASHPGPNERGDLLCATLQDLGYTVD